MAKSIMFVGTNSSAGKSFFTTAMCRVLSDDGYTVSPFKSQNMALNSFIDDNGLEFGRAQAVQAYAGRKTPDARMNPILLKPTSDRKSEVVLLGKKTDTYDAKKYYEVKEKYLPYIKQAYQELSDDVDVMVIEGAGSPAEINLLDGDFVNMGMSEIANAPVILVADIDKGGVFASIYGTIMLTPEKWRKNYKGIIINKFRGEKSILDSGIKQIEQMLNIPVISVMPYVDVDIEEEDSLTTRLKKSMSDNKKINITILRLPNLSNFTEFAPLNMIDDVNINYIKIDDEIPQNTDLLVIPATKNVIADINSLNDIKMSEKIKNFENEILAVGNGVDILCEKVKCEEEINGLGLLDTISNRIEQETGKGKYIVSSKKGILKNTPDEINLTYIKKSRIISRNTDNMIIQKDNVLGICGFSIFENADFANAMLNNIREKKGIEQKISMVSYSEYREAQIAKLGDEFRKYIDVQKLYEIIEKGL